MEFLIAWTWRGEEAFSDFIEADSPTQARTKWREKNATLEDYEIETVRRVRNDEEVC